MHKLTGNYKHGSELLSWSRLEVEDAYICDDGVTLVQKELTEDKKLKLYSDDKVSNRFFNQRYYDCGGIARKQTTQNIPKNVEFFYFECGIESFFHSEHSVLMIGFSEAFEMVFSISGMAAKHHGRTVKINRRLTLKDDTIGCILKRVVIKENNYRLIQLSLIHISEPTRPY